LKTIDAPTEGIVVPFGVGGRQVINDLCAAFEIEKQYELLRRAQQFTVNVFPQVLQTLKASHAVQPVQEDIGVQYLDERYYSDEYGLVTEQISGMELLDA
jgi:CRISPR-associated endonuclease/helicase Cas3